MPCVPDRCPSLAFAAVLASKLMGQDPGSPTGCPQPLQLSSSFYLINPDGDLPDTQQTFEAQLQQLCREVRGPSVCMGGGQG